MLPPSADIVRIRIVEKPDSCARVRASVASTRPSAAAAAAVDDRHHDEAGQMREQRQPERDPAPQEHHA